MSLNIRWTKSRRRRRRRKKKKRREEEVEGMASQHLWPSWKRLNSTSVGWRWVWLYNINYIIIYRLFKLTGPPIIRPQNNSRNLLRSSGGQLKFNSKQNITIPYQPYFTTPNNVLPGGLWAVWRSGEPCWRGAAGRRSAAPRSNPPAPGGRGNQNSSITLLFPPPLLFPTTLSGM